MANFLMVLEKDPSSGEHVYRKIMKPAPSWRKPTICANDKCKELLFHRRVLHQLTKEYVCRPCYCYFYMYQRDREPRLKRKKMNQEPRNMIRKEFVFSENSAFNTPQVTPQTSPRLSEKDEKKKNESFMIKTLFGLN